MGIIIPAILPSSREDLEQKLAVITDLTKEVQIDIVDGKYASPSTWPYAGEEKNELQNLCDSGEMLPFAGRFRFETDLMVMNPEEVAGLWIDAGVNRLTIHAESTPFLANLIEKFRVIYGHDKDFVPDLLSFGLAVGLNTDLRLIEPYLDKADYVQFMGIAKIGHQGEPFDPRVLKRIMSFKKKYPNMQIQVDGGVSLPHIGELLRAGVDRLIVGSAIWKEENVQEAFKKLQTTAAQYSS